MNALLDQLIEQVNKDDAIAYPNTMPMAYYKFDTLLKAFVLYNHKNIPSGCTSDERAAMEWVYKWNTHCLPNPNTLAPNTTACFKEPCPTIGNNPMRFDEYGNRYATMAVPQAAASNITVLAAPAETSDEMKQRKYLLERASEVKYELVRALSEQFYITFDGPRTAKEAADRLKNGQYTLTVPNEDEDDEDSDYFDFWDHFSWRTQKADQKGFKDAKEKLDKAYVGLKDIITIGDPADGLKALKEFETWTV